MQERAIPVANGQFTITVAEAGDGPPLLFLHGISGLQWDETLDALARDYRVIAPRTPGFGDESQAALDDIHDLVFAYLDLLDALDLHDVAMVGHSLGGMIAAELAATQPDRFRRIVLLAPLGLFDVQRPTYDFFATTAQELAAALFKDPEAPAARAAGDRGMARLAEVGPDTEEGQQLIEVYVERQKTLATAAKYLWPVPNRGLHKRIHRITAPVLLLWGAADAIIAPSYAEDFQRALSDARCEQVDAGHELLLEAPDAVRERIAAFVE